MKTILDDVMNINVGKGDTSGATDGNRALAIAQLRDVKLEYSKYRCTGQQEQIF